MTMTVAKEWDLSDRRGPADSRPETLIQEFARRGAAVPFTTSGLLNSRVRAASSGALEVVVPGLGGTKGVYVIPMKDLPLAVTMSVHDRVMHKLILERQATNPDLLRLVTLEVAKQGLAGPQAASQAVEALNREAMDRLICAVYLIRIAFAKVEGGGTALSLEEITSKEGQVRVRALLGTLAKETNSSADALYAAIEQWGDVIAAIGVPEMDQPCRLRRLVRAVLDLSSQLMRWSQNDDSTDAERAVALSGFAKDIGVAGKQILATIDGYATDFVGTLVRWEEAKGEIALLVDQLCWMLDGWDHHIDRWRDAAQASRPIQVTAVHAIADAYPDRIRKATPPPAAVKAAERTAKLGRLTMNQDWRSGAITDIGKPRAAPATPAEAAHVGALGEKQFDLSEDQLGKLVGVLSKARDAKGGDSLSLNAFDMIRPRLKVSQPFRPLTMERLFCVPFEDFLADGSVPPRAGSILRSSIRPCWKLVEEQLPTALRDAMGPKVDAVATRDHAILFDLGKELWPVADAALSTLLARAEDDPAERARMAEKLGGDQCFTDLVEIGLSMQVAARIMQLRGFLSPKPVLDINAQRLAGILEVFDTVKLPTRLPQLLRVLLARVADPAELLQGLANLAGTDLRARKLGAAVRAEMLSDLLQRVTAMTADTPATALPPGQVAAIAEEAAERIQALGEMPPAGEGSAGDAMARIKEGVAAAVRGAILGKAEGVVLAALAGAPADAAQGFEAMARAETHALALRQCAGCAQALGLLGEITEKLNSLAKAVEGATDKLLGEAPGDATARRAMVVHAIRMLEILSNPNRADQLRIRVDKALG
jgi:hypothetical protein